MWNYYQINRTPQVIISRWENNVLKFNYFRQIKIENTEHLEQHSFCEKVKIVSKINIDSEISDKEAVKCLNDKILKSENDHENKNIHKEKKIFSKKFNCDKCDKKYTWYSGLANHKRFVHNKIKERKEM